ncbi:MAG: cytochrome [Blastopirellula sp.]|nr:MAG: cytochrome [Blastopirellula sp.]
MIMQAQKFDLVSPEFKRNPFPVFSEMRSCGSIVQAKLPLIGRVWMATTYDAAVDMLRDHERFPQQAVRNGKKNVAGIKWWMPKALKVLTNNMLLQDEPDHRRLRGLVEQAFMQHSIEEFRPRIETIVDQFLDELELKFKQSGSVDLIEHFARPFPLAIICELMGLPDEDRPMFSRWAQGITNSGSIFSFLSMIPKLWKMNGYFTQQFKKCRVNPVPGLLSSLVSAEQDGHQLSEDELLAMAFLLLFAGHETTVHSLSGSVWTLLQHADQLEALQANWSNIDLAIEELLRFLTPVQMTKPRIAAMDMEFHGQPIQQGDYIIALLAAANCDPEKFDRPEVLNLLRDPNPHLAFGSGIHVCLGLKLARAEMAIALEKLFSRFPKLHLAVPEKELQWKKMLGLRSLLKLPVKLA